MSNRKWTPGPWGIEVAGNGDAIDAPGRKFMPFGGCGCCGSPWMNGESQAAKIADAALISAAPDLYEALEALMELESRGRIMPMGSEWDAARAALAKARGE